MARKAKRITALWVESAFLYSYPHASSSCRSAKPPSRKQSIQRTRHSTPQNSVFDLAQEMLRDAPELEAKALFEHLMTQSAGKIEQKYLRTFQRRVRERRVKNGPEKEVFFTQDQTPGKVLAMDWTDMGAVGITIGGRVLKHKFIIRAPSIQQHGGHLAATA